MALIMILLVIWLVLVVLGTVLEGLFWLTIVGVVLLIGTAAYGWMKRKAASV
jgi:LPXTG-motif cell wall-anchored protein